MKDKIQFQQSIGCNMVRNRKIEHELVFSNPIGAQLFRRGKLIATVGGFNGVTIAGKNHILDLCFGAAAPLTQVDPWYIGLIKQSPTPTLSENDTLASHAGWTEAAGYSGSRKEWVDTDAVSKVKGTTTASTFVFNASDTIHGIFIASVASGTSGVLWATGSFDTPLSVADTDECKITYGLRC